MMPPSIVPLLRSSRILSDTFVTSDMKQSSLAYAKLFLRMDGTQCFRLSIDRLRIHGDAFVFVGNHGISTSPSQIIRSDSQREDKSCRSWSRPPVRLVLACFHGQSFHRLLPAGFDSGPVYSIAEYKSMADAFRKQR